MKGTRRHICRLELEHFNTGVKTRTGHWLPSKEQSRERRAGDAGVMVRPWVVVPLLPSLLSSDLAPVRFPPSGPVPSV